MKIQTALESQLFQRNTTALAVRDINFGTRFKEFVNMHIHYMVYPLYRRKERKKEENNFESCTELNERTVMQVLAYNRTVCKTRQEMTIRIRGKQNRGLTCLLTGITVVWCSCYQPDVRVFDQVVLCTAWRQQIVCLLFLALRSRLCYLFVLVD